ncbi:MAG: TonB-dependent receptor plug domain-containing protein [Myxococcaceae bacterium]
MAKRRARSLALGLGLSLALTGGAARAGADGGAPAPDQSPGGGAGVGTVELDPVLVPLPTDEPQAASPTRRDPSGSLSLIEVSEHRGEAKDTAELLSGAPGVMVQDTGGMGQAKTLSVRGTSASGVLVLLDGIPLNGAGGSVDLSRIPSAVIERLEVLRGGAGARYGSGGLGGVVNVVTRKSESGGRLFAELTQGGPSTTLAEVGAAGAVAGGQGMLLVHAGRSEGDFSYRVDPLPELEGNPLETHTRENNQALGGAALFKFRRPLPGGVTADASLVLSADSRGLAGPLEAPSPDGHQSTNRGALGLRLTRALDAGEVEAHLWVRRDDLALRGGMWSQLSQQELSGGGEVTVSRLVSGWHGLSATVVVAGESLSVPGESDPSWARLSLMVSDEVLIAGGALVLAPSVRLDQTGPYTGISPKLGATALLPKGFELRANLGQAHRAPSFLELYVQQGFFAPNDTLRPERALTADLGVSHRSRSSFVQVSGFASLYEDLISYEYRPPLLSRPYNFAAARVAGLEAEGQARPFPWLSAAASYTLLASQNLRDDPRYYLNELPFRPHHKLSARLSAGPSWARARAELLYQSQQWTNRSQTVALAPRAFVNAGISSELHRAPGLTASFEVKNLLDASSEDLAGYPLPGRSAYLTLALSWDVSH